MSKDIDEVKLRSLIEHLFLTSATDEQLKLRLVKNIKALIGPSHYLDEATEHSVPCESCGATFWVDWVLKPDTLFNLACPGGNGYLCFNCFAERFSQLKQLHNEGEVT